MLPMDRVEITAFRFLGGIGSCFTLFQSIIWLGLSITGASCKYFECGATNNKRSFGYCFYLMYFYGESDNSTARLNAINPHYFNIMMWVTVVLSLMNFIISAITLSAFLQWINAILVKRITTVWTISIILFSIIECLMCATFIYDITVIVGKNDSKCFMKAELTFFRSAYEPKPAPYLHDLKSNLQKLRKKIRNLKKNLHFLNVVVDENDNPDHIENPFISKTVLNNHVKDVWHEMFNNSILDKVQPQRRRGFLPKDEVMRKFIEKKNIHLDKVDTGLLKMFDSLTNIKWVKPVEHSNVAIGTTYLNTNIDLGNQTRDINQMAILLHEYLKNLNEPPRELVKADKMLDNVTKTYLRKLYGQLDDMYNKDLKNKFKMIRKEITQDDTFTSKNFEEEEILLYLKQFMDGLMLLEEVDDAQGNFFQSLVKNITDLFRKNENLEIDNDQKVQNIKEYLRKQYDSDYDDNKAKPEISFKRVNSEKPKSEQLSSSSSELVKELCENCAFFALWPSIVCMLLSLKTGLVWVLNVIIVSLVLYYGEKIEIRRKSKLSSVIKYE